MNQNKETITEKELLELANRYIQLEQEHEQYVKAAYQIITKLQIEINELKTKYNEPINL
jgi:NAD(P)H-nitrite reductase large subunit